MSGGAFDYIEFVIDSINSDLERFDEFLNDPIWVTSEMLPVAHKYNQLSFLVTKLRQYVNQIDTKFIHDVEWATSGDINMSAVIEKWKNSP